MSEIKPLFENINTFLLPKSIKRSISKLNSFNRRNKNRENLELPELIYFKESDCYILVEHFTDFNKRILNGLEDEKGVKITDDSKKILLNKYGEGFRSGYNNFEESLKGSLQVGKFADFIEIDTDLLEAEPNVLQKAKILKTYINGQLVWEK